MAFRRIKSICFLAFLLSLLFAGSVLLFHSLILNPSVQDYLLKRLSEGVGYDITANRIQLLLGRKIGLRAQDVEIRLPEGADILATSSITITFSLPDLIRGQIVPAGLVLVEPQIELDVRDPLREPSSGHAPVSGAPSLKVLAGFPRIDMERAQISFKKMPLRSNSLFVHLSRRSKEPPAFDVTLNGKIDYCGESVPLSATGRIDWDKTGGTLAQGMLKARGIPLTLIRLPDVPVKKGTADIEATAIGTANGVFSAKGDIRIRDVAFTIIDGDDKKTFAFDTLLLPFDASYSGSTLEVPSFQMKGPGFTLHVASKLDLGDQSDPHLSLKVRSDPMSVETFHRIFPSSLLPQWVDTELFPIFSGGRVRVDRFSLDGKVSHIRDLDLPKNAGALELKLTCNDLTAFKDDGGVPVEGVKGGLHIVKGKVRAFGITGRFRNSTIQEGSLTVSSLYEDAPVIRVTAAGSVRIEDLLHQKDLSLIPDEVGEHLERFSSSTGKIQGTIEVGYEKDWPYPKMLQGSLKFENCAVASSAGAVFPVWVQEGELIVDTKEKRRFAAKGRWGRSAVDASGWIGESWETGKADIVADIDLVELISHFYPQLHSPFFFRRPAPCRLTLVKGEKDWRCNGLMELKDISLETDSMTVAPFGRKGDLSFSGGIIPGEKISISSLTCASGESAFTLSGLCDLRKNGRYDLRVSSRKLRLQDMGVHFKKGNLMGKGSLAFEADIQGSRSHPEFLVTGNAKGIDLSFAAREFPHPVEECNFALTFQGKDLAIDTLDLKLGKTPLHIEGNLQGWDGMRGNMTIHSDFLDFSDLISPELIAYFKNDPAQTENGIGPARPQAYSAWRDSAGRIMKRSDIQLELEAVRGQWEGFPCGPLRMTCALRSGDLYIGRSSATWDHGKLMLRGHMKRGREPEMLFSGYVDMTQQPLKKLPPSLDFITSRGEGLLTMEALLFARGADRKALVSNLSGNVNVLLEQGVLKKSNIFIKILDSLSLQKIFEKRPSHLSREGIYFEHIGATIDLEKGVAASKDVVMRSPAFNAAITGEADLRTERVTGEIGIQPLGTLDFLISNVPVAGYLLTGDQKALYVEYFKFDGPLSDPDVQYIPLKSIGSGTVGFLSRLLLTPKRIYDSIEEAARDFEGDGYPVPDAHLDPKNDMGG